MPFTPAQLCTLWTLRKTGRTATCHVVTHPLGLEVRMDYNGELLQAIVFRDYRGCWLRRRSGGRNGRRGGGRTERAGEMTSDHIVLGLMHLILYGAVAVAVIRQLHWMWKLGRHGSRTVLTVRRGPASMAAFYFFFAVSLGLYTAIVAATEDFRHRSLLILVDVVLICYLFVFSSWFRNGVVFRLVEWLETD